MTKLAPSEISLTTPQIAGLKLAKSGDLYPQTPKRWTHLNAEVTYAKNDRFKERPQKVKFLTTTTLEELRDLGFVERLNIEADAANDAHQITMAGKIWLMANK